MTNRYSEEELKIRRESALRSGIRPPVKWGKDHPNWKGGKALWKRTLNAQGYGHSGERHFNWKGGVTSLNHKIRNCFQYRQWRSDCFQRDDYTCQDCNQRGGKLEVDHIKTYSSIMRENDIKTMREAEVCEELWNINNGRTLCVPCHRKTPTWGGNSKPKKSIHKTDL